MLVGVNWISPQSLPIIKQLIEAGVAEFCEIMVDNFAHLPASMIREALPDIPIGLHIVASRFLERSLSDLDNLAHVLRPWIRDLNPLYVSDHLVQFSATSGDHLPFTTELNYQNHARIFQRVRNWQALLDTPILFENYASIVASGGTRQVDFFEKLLAEKQGGLLFDISNAYIAQCNHVCDISAWDALAQKAQHFHVAGFSYDTTTALAIDSHDKALAANVLQWIRQHFANVSVARNASIIVEFDANVSFDTWKTEILKIKKELAA